MGNFKTHNTPIFDYKLTSEDYWDFHLALDNFSAIGDLNDACLASYIDISDMECIIENNLVSKNNYTWESAFNDGVTFENIGLTGVDNGLFTYDKDRITNKDFLKIFTESSHTFEPNDYRLHLNKVEGNNKIYSYEAEITDGAVKLNGGFFQGFFKDASNTYQILPHIIENGWQIEVTLKKEDFSRTAPNIRLNDHYPENKGIFFFIGTRAENKWWNYYKVNTTFDESEADYLDIDFSNLSSNYDNFLITDSTLDDYIEEDIKIDASQNIVTQNGLSVKDNDEIFIDTNNKFLLFDRTENGYTTCTWGENEENTQFTLQMKAPVKTDNYFLLFDRTEHGYTTCNFDDYLSTYQNQYDVYADIYNNALAFIINDKGEIGYRYTIKDCENNEPTTISEFSRFSLIKEKQWHTISVRIKPSNILWVDNYKCPDIRTPKGRTMKLFFYVDGYLKMVTKDIPMLGLKALATQTEKQEGVPFNISLGGGTQGLCDTVNLDFKNPPKDVLFLEKHYAGSFIGWIKDFKFYVCPQNLTQLRNNVRNI